MNIEINIKTYILFQQIMRFVKEYIPTTIFLLTVDLIWIFGIMGSFYNNQFSAFPKPETVPIWSGVMAWALIPLGIVVFVNRNSKNWKESMLNGGLYGFILYGVYDFTNYATLGNWPLQLVIVDILWGTFLCSISSITLKKVSKWLK